MATATAISLRRCIPSHRPDGPGRCPRIATYMVFTRFLVTSVLHFPAIKGNYGGDPLAFLDSSILIVLWHAVAFGGHFVTCKST